DAAFGHVHHVDNDWGHVLNAGELIELHVGVDHAAGLAVVDALFEEGVVEAHDDATSDLRFAGQLVDDQTDVLHGDYLGAFDRAGLGIDLDLGDLHAADPGLRHAGRPIAVARGGGGAQARAGLSPRHALVIGAVDDAAPLDGQVHRLGGGG